MGPFPELLQPPMVSSKSSLRFRFECREVIIVVVVIIIITNIMMTILSETGSVTAAPIYVLLKDILAIAFAPLNSAPPPHWVSLK